MSEGVPNSDGLNDALDRALAKTLRSPALPAGFRGRLEAQMAALARADESAIRAEIEAEYQGRLAQMRSEFVRLRWRTLFTLLSAAFVAGALVTVGMPWLVATFGSYASYVVPGGLALAAVGAALNAALRRSQISF